MPINDSLIHLGKSLSINNYKAVTEYDPLAIEAIDYIEIFTENAKQTAFFFCKAFGFTPYAFRGPETKYPEAASYCLKQQNITIVITSALRITNPIASFVHLHGTSAKDLALRVPDCESFYYEAISRGATSVMAPTLFEDANGQIKKASIKTYGDVIHSLIERKDYSGTFWPGFVPYSEIGEWKDSGPDVGLIVVDHIVGNVELGAMNKWVNFYENTLGFKQLLHFTEDDISTEYSALMSKVMHNGNGKIKFPINEPAQGRRKSQIEEYLDFHNGAGVQHIACGCKDIIQTVSALKERGVQFLTVPKSYYDEIPNRVGTIKEDMNKIAALGVLVDRDDDGYLLQLFTKPVQDRPTLFFEIIQREGSLGFGVGNFKALFEAIEREQEKRGNL